MPTIRVNTRLVLVDVVVTDKNGQPIRDLKPADFAVEENGKKQKVTTFSAPGEARKAAPASLPPGIYSNEPEFRAPAGPTTVFVLDAANTSFRDQAYGRLQMLKYVDEQSKSTQRTAIFTLTDALHMVQDFTDDPQLLKEALKRYKPQEPVLSGGGPPPVSTGLGPSIGPGAALQAALSRADAALRDYEAIQLTYLLERRTETTLEGMRSLARVLGGLPGRKEVIWLTAAFPFDLIPEDRNISEAEAEYMLHGIQQRSLANTAGGVTAERERTAHWEEIRKAAAQMSSAQIALYPIDVRGLASGMEVVSFNDLANRQRMDTSATAVARMSDMASDQETMRAIAGETGGKVYVNQNEIKDGITIALADNISCYTIGYYPEDKKWNGKYRSIKIKLNRDGTQARYRKGYFALDPTELKDRRPDQEVAEALRDALPATLVGFKAQVKPGEKGKVRVVFLVDAHTLSVEDTSGGKRFNVSFYAAPVGADGKISGTRTTKVDQAFKPEIYQQIVQKGIMTPLDVDLPPNAKEVRLAVRDERTGNIGTIDAPLVQ